MTPSLFDLPVRPPEVAKLAALVVEQAGSKPLTNEVRARVAARSALLKLEGLEPWYGSLERDPIHPGALYIAAAGCRGEPFLLRIAPASTPSSGLFPNAILIARMAGPGGSELVVNAVPFAHTDHVAIATFSTQVNTAFQPRAPGARSVILVSGTHPEKVLPAAFEAFREILTGRSLNLAGTADAQAGTWAAIRAGWREGFVADPKGSLKDALPAAQLNSRRRCVCLVETGDAQEAVHQIMQCSQFLY